MVVGEITSVALFGMMDLGAFIWKTLCFPVGEGTGH